MAAIKIQTATKVTPQCYAYTTPGVPAHDCWTKIGFTERDVDLYLERVEQSVPKSVEAAQMSGEQLEDYLKQLRERRR